MKKESKDILLQTFIREEGTLKLIFRNSFYSFVLTPHDKKQRDITVSKIKNFSRKGALTNEKLLEEFGMDPRGVLFWEFIKNYDGDLRDKNAPRSLLFPDFKRITDLFFEGKIQSFEDAPKLFSFLNGKTLKDFRL